MAGFILKEGMKVHSHLTHFSNNNGSLKGTVVMEVISVNPGLLNFRAKITKTGTEVTVPLNAVVRPVGAAANGLSKKAFRDLADKFNGSH